VAQAPRHDPRAIITRILETTEVEQSATAEAAESTQAMVEVRTPGELFADAAARVTTARTATWLDALMDDGTVTPVRQQCHARLGQRHAGRDTPEEGHADFPFQPVHLTRKRRLGDP
jgi:hypothetical protein